MHLMWSHLSTWTCTVVFWSLYSDTMQFPSVHPKLQISGQHLGKVAASRTPRLRSGVKWNVLEQTSHKLCPCREAAHGGLEFSSPLPVFGVQGCHTKLSSMLEHSRKESTSRGLISCWWSAASMLSGHPAASLLKAACRHTRMSKQTKTYFRTMQTLVWMQL